MPSITSLGIRPWSKVVQHMDENDRWSAGATCSWLRVTVGAAAVARDEAMLGAVAIWRSKAAHLLKPDTRSRPLKRLSTGAAAVCWRPMHSGKHSIVSSAFIESTRVAVKRCREDSAGASLQKEAAGLAAANAVGIGPQLIAHAPDCVVMEWVDGLPLVDYLLRATQRAALWAVHELLDQCRRLDAVGLAKEEMTHPQRHVIITGPDRMILIDFDRANVCAQVRNVPQVCSYLSGRRLLQLLSRSNVSVDVATLRNAAAEYKRNPSDETYGAVRRCFGGTVQK
eukprot:TRINITY_DN44312_c0_g1_i1.p1 TRINITY_DN44312_c0_g1~~TRINITY_DN44312_c0_g1_i1.p1  ORF type:complete len:283 (+),score=31.59 TRINITY_DN44312_c0_g1_i1:64-912(+)